MFIDFSIKDLIDILLVAYLLYQTYRLMKDSGSINIFIGILNRGNGEFRSSCASHTSRRLRCGLRSFRGLRAPLRHNSCRKR